MHHTVLLLHWDAFAGYLHWMLSLDALTGCLHLVLSFGAFIWRSHRAPPPCQRLVQPTLSQTITTIVKFNKIHCVSIALYNDHYSFSPIAYIRLPFCPLDNPPRRSRVWISDSGLRTNSVWIWSNAQDACKHGLFALFRHFFSSFSSGYLSLKSRAEAEQRFLSLSLRTIQRF